MCYLSKNLQNTSHFVTLFSAQRWGGVPSFIKEHHSANLSLKNLLCMEDSKNPIASR
jgi:hypothetical protein